MLRQAYESIMMDFRIGSNIGGVGSRRMDSLFIDNVNLILIACGNFKS